MHFYGCSVELCESFQIFVYSTFINNGLFMTNSHDLQEFLFAPIKSKRAEGIKFPESGACVNF